MESIIDRDEVLDRVDGDMELLAEMVEIFLEDCPGLLTGIQKAIESQDVEALEYSAHTLKGAVGNFAAVGAFEAAFKLEEMGRTSNIIGANEAYMTLAGEMERLRPVLSALRDEAI